MSATRLALGLFAFQIPVVLAILVGIPWLGLRDPSWMLYIGAPTSVVLLLGSLITWAFEQLRPLPPERKGPRMLRYQLPAFILANLPLAGVAFLAGALFRSNFDWGDALGFYGLALGAYLVLVALPIVALSLNGAVTPPPRS